MFHSSHSMPMQLQFNRALNRALKALFATKLEKFNENICLRSLRLRRWNNFNISTMLIIQGKARFSSSFSMEEKFPEIPPSPYGPDLS